MQQAETHRPLSLTGIATAGALVVLMLLALCTWGASAAQAGTLIVTKGGDRNVNSNSFTGGTNYAQNLSGAQFQYSSSASGPWTDIPGSTGSNGQVSITLSSGYYFVREKAAASGFANFGPLQTVNFNNGSQPYVARVQVTNSGTTYAHPHTNSSSNSSNWTPTNSNSGSNNNGSPFLDVRDNGTVENACGQNILLVLDRSGSIEPYKSSYEQAAKEFVNQLNGTPTQIGIISFNNSVNSYSPSQGNSNYYHAPLDLSSSGSAATLNGTIENVYNNPSSYTNWDGALQAAAGAKGFTANTSTGQTANPDLVVFITDGNPTTSQLGGTNGNTALTDISSGIASANLVKNQNSRRPGKKLKLLAIGVGSGVTASNLSVVSGPIQGVDGDYAVPTIPQLQSFLQELAATQCGARVYVRKRIAGGDGTNQPNWKYSAVDPRSGHTPSWMDGNNATHSTGSPAVIQTGAFFTNLPTNPTTVQVNENATGQPVSNFSLTGVVCRKGGYESGQTVNGTQSGLNYSLPVNRGDAIYCTYTNAVNTTLSINKTPDNQTINAGDDAEFTIVVANTGSNTATSALVSDQLPDPGVGGWTVSQQPSGGNCTVSGASLLGCTLGNLSAGQSRTIKVKTGTDKDYCGVYDNQAARASAANASEVTDAGKITCQKPSLEVVKSATNDPINAGEDAEFSITLTNNGPGVAKGATLSDPLPTGTAGAWTIVSQSGGPPACAITGSGANGGGTLACGPKNLNKNDSYTVKVKASTSVQACGTYNNTATGSATNAANATDSASIHCQTAGLGILKTAVQGTINAGENAEFTIVTSNTGDGVAKAVTMTDPLPDGASGPWTITDQPGGDPAPCTITGDAENGYTLTCNFGDMASGASHSVTVSAPTDFEHCITLDNTASATSTNAPGDSDDASINCQKPNLSVTKTAENGTINAGDTAKFTIRVANGGPGVAKNVSLNDPLPSGAGGWSIASQPSGNPCSIAGGTLSCANLGDLAAGADVTIVITARTSYENCEVYNNTATASASNAPNATGNDKITCLKPSLSVTKTAENGTINAGDTAKFTIRVANGGPGVAKNVSLNDPLPSGAGGWSIASQPSGNPCSIAGGTLSCANLGDLAAGADVTIVITAQTSYENCEVYNNTATASASNAPNATGNDKITCLKPSLQVTKTAANGTINAGDDAQFSITLKNNGPGVAKNATLSDPLPAGTAGDWTVTPEDPACSITAGVLACAFGDLGNGESRTVTVKAPTSNQACTTYNNTATGSAGNAPDATGSATITCRKPSLSITKTAAAANVNAGDDIQFTVKVSNAGPGAANNVKVSDPLPGGTQGDWTIVDQPTGDPCSITTAGILNCDFGNLTAGQDRTVTIKAGTSYDACTIYDNTATVTSDNAGTDQANAKVTCDKPDLGILKTAVQGTINAGENAEFTIVTSNTGDGVAKAVTMTDPLPSGVSGDWEITDQPDGDPCTITDNKLTCDFGDMASGASHSVTVSAPTDFENCTTLDNTASATSTNAPDASDSDSINCQTPSLEIDKSATNDTINAGDDAEFSITLTNNGPGVAKGATLSDPLPTGTAGAWTIVSQSGGPPACAITGSGANGGGTLDCGPKDLNKDDAYVVKVKAPTSAEACTTYENTATGSANNYSPDVQASATIDCETGVVGVLKTAVHGTINAGENAEFTIVTSNTGAGTAKNVTMTDPLPSGVSGDWEITDQPDGDPCTITDNKLTCDFGDMASGASHSVTVSAPSDFENCTTLDNTATATSSNANGDSSQASIDCLKPNLKIEKTPKDGSIDAGDDAAFTIVVSNPESDEGTGTATGVLVSDQLPSNGSNAWSVTSDPEDLGCAVDDNDLLDCGPFDLEAGEQVTITLTSKTDKDHCTVYDNGVDNENGATASAVNGGPPVTDSGMITCHNPNLATLKTAVEGTISAGDTASFTITVSNVATEGGTGIARDVTLDDPLPAGTSGPWTITDQPDGDPAPCAVTGDAQSGYKLHCEFGDLPAGEGGSRSVTVSAPTNFENCAVLDNTATASGSNAHDASDSDSIHCQKPNLTVHKSGNGTVNAGEDVEFTITVANSGPGVARNVTLSDSVPSGVADAWTISSQPGESCAISGGVLNCDFGDMDAESSYTVKITAPTDYEHCATYDNTATASASNSPDASGRDSVNCLKPEVNITKEGSGKTGTGQNVSFTIKVTNTGSGVARGVVVNDPLSDLAGPWSISSQSEGANCQIVNGGAQPAGTEGAPTLRCQVGDLKSGGTITVTVTAKMNPTVCQTINNTATVTSENAPERSDRAQVTCVKPRLQLRKKANRKAVLPGQKVRYTILVRNRKVGSVATNLRICDRIPPKMTVVNRGSGHFSNGRLCWKINRLEGSKKWTKRSYVTRVDRTANGGERLKNVVTLKNLRAHRTVRVKHPPVQHKRKRHTPVTG